MPSSSLGGGVKRKRMYQQQLIDAGRHWVDESDCFTTRFDDDLFVSSPAVGNSISCHSSYQGVTPAEDMWSRKGNLHRTPWSSANPDVARLLAHRRDRQ